MVEICEAPVSWYCSGADSSNTRSRLYFGKHGQLTVRRPPAAVERQLETALVTAVHSLDLPRTGAPNGQRTDLLGCTLHGRLVALQSRTKYERNCFLLEQSCRLIEAETFAETFALQSSLDYLTIGSITVQPKRATTPSLHSVSASQTRQKVSEPTM